MKPARTAQAAPPVKWPQMTRRQKVVYVAKLAVCILSFGFIFPGITQD